MKTCERCRGLGLEPRRGDFEDRSPPLSDDTCTQCGGSGEVPSTGAVVVCPLCCDRDEGVPGGCYLCDGGQLALPLDPHRLPSDQPDWPAILFDLGMCRQIPDCDNCEDTGETSRLRGPGMDPCSECELGAMEARRRAEWARAVREDDPFAKDTGRERP